MNIIKIKVGKQLYFDLPAKLQQNHGSEPNSAKTQHRIKWPMLKGP